MSNMDSLLDLGDSNGPPPNSPPKGGEVFDPFAPVTPTSPSQDQPGSRDPFDDFDPFSPTMSSAANGMDSGNPLYEASQNEEEYMESKLSEKERMSIEQQFDDLLGGLSESSSSNILSNGSSLASPGDVDTKTTVVTETYSGDEDEVTRVTETRTEIHDGGTTVVKTTVVEETRHEVMEPGSPSEEFEEYSHPAEAESPSPVGSPTNMESPLRSPSATSPASPTNPPVTPPGGDIRTTEVHSPSLTKSPSVSSASSAEVMIERSELEPADVHVSPTANLAQPESDHSDVESHDGSISSEGERMVAMSPTGRSDSSDQGTRFEDTLADFVPPKRYVKPEEKSYRAPEVYITSDSREDNGAPAPENMRARTAATNGRHADSATEYETQPSQPFNSLLANWKTNKEPQTKETQGAGGDMCRSCGKRVYEMEKMIADKHIYHKMCFKCHHCKRILSLGNFASIDAQTYCKPHFIEIFKTKGNYEEGFGMERRAKQWTQAKGSSPEPNEASLRATPDSEDGRGHIEIVRAEDKQEEPENLPSIKNLKSRFELQGQDGVDADGHVRTPSPASRRPAKLGSPYGGADRRSPGHVNGDSHVSKWDKPRDTPPPPVVNRQENDEELLEAELPPQGMSRNILAKFREMEQGSDSESYSPQRKPVRKITPPRGELQYDVNIALEQHGDVEYREVVRAGDEVNKEDELPPREYTKSLLAKFKQMENADEPPPSPMRTQSLRQMSKKTTVSYTKPSPDSGISDGETQPTTNGRHAEYDRLREEGGGVYENEPVVKEDVVKSGEKHDENEFPEYGFTRGLLAQWKSKEVTSPGSSAPKKERQQSRGQSYTTHHESYSTEGAEMAESGQYESQPVPRQDVVRESDRVEEDELPPPSYTKNMLAKFQSMQAEADTGSPKHVPKKQFKFTVRPPGNLTPHVHNQDAHSSYEDLRSSSANSDYIDREIVHATDSTNLEDELPPSAYTKNLLDKFRSMEDLNKPPPTPDGSTVSRKGSSGPQDRSSRMSHLSMSSVEFDFDSESDQPQSGKEVVKAADPGFKEDELPPPAFTRNLLERFKSMEDSSKPPPTPEDSHFQRHSHSPARSGGSSIRSNSPSVVDGKLQVYHEREQPEGGEYESMPNEFLQYEGVPEGGEFENNPVRDPSIVRAEDKAEEELPEQGTTRNLLARFQAMQQK